MRHQDRLLAERDDGLRRLSRLTWRATQLSAVAVVGIATLFARTATATPAYPVQPEADTLAAAEPASAQPYPVPDDDQRLEVRRLIALMASRPALAPATGPATSAIALGRPAVPSVAGRTTTALGTFCSVLVTAPAALDLAQSLLGEELGAIDLACSRFRPDSELSALNRAGGRQVAISPLFALALTVALRAAEITDGDVDPTCGHSLVRLGYDRDYAELAADTSELPLPPAPAAGWHRVQLDAGDARISAELSECSAIAERDSGDRPYT